MASTSARADRPLLHLGLFAATIATTFLTFLWQFFGKSYWSLIAPRPSLQEVTDSLAFSLCLVLILGAHEMGHYLLARWHKVDSSLPYFIPLPMLGFGTLGAVIRIRERIPDRNALVDIGAAGPLAGVVVAIPVIVIGLLHSKLVPSVAHAAPALFPGDWSLWSIGRAVLAWGAGHFGVHLSAPHIDWLGGNYVFGDSLLMSGLQKLVLGALPAGQDLVIHPVVVAGWFGLLVTMMNLVPIGQLDGGHLTYAMLGPRARTLGKAMALGLLFLTVFCSAFWFLWLIVTVKVIGFGHPEVVEPEAPMSRGRRAICLVSLLLLVLCFMPAPFSVV